jgi:hypothetical protein
VTTPSPWALADADPVGAATGWLAGHQALTELLASLATGAGRQIGTINAPPYPRLRITDTNGDLGEFRGLSWVSLGIDVFGDLDGRPGKAALRRLAIATAETLHQMTEQPAVGGCVFSQVTTNSISWAPLAPGNQPRYVLNTTLWSRPAWESST